MRGQNQSPESCSTLPSPHTTNQLGWLEDLLLQLALHGFLYSLQDLVFGQLAGIKEHRVTGRDQRGRCAGPVTAIAFSEFRGQGLRRRD